MVAGVLHEQVWSQIDAVLFDLDGVITPSAELHQRAWLLALTAFSATEGDYLSFIDGRPRLDGVKTFLESRNLHLPDGAEGDEPSINTVHGIAALKQQSFLQILDQERFAPYSGSIALLDALEQRGTPFGLVTSSKNSAAVLSASGLSNRFNLIVDGNVAVREHLNGKPAPDTYLFAARAIGVAPQRCAVIEDAVSGVTAGRNGEFGLVIGVERGAGNTALRAAGAHLVVQDLIETLA